jgi:hypothetical protein
MKLLNKICILIVLATTHSVFASEGWISIFDGKTLDGWRAPQSPNSWKIEDGLLVTDGPLSHLYYDGAVQNHNFRNFEFTADIKTTPGSNSGIYIHTALQNSGFPSKGYECQVCNPDPNARPGSYAEHKLTGSLYSISNVWKSPVKDNEWFNYRIAVQGKTIRIYVNDNLMVDYTENQDAYRPADKKERLLSSGTFALQCHNAGSIVYFKNIKVKPLPDDLPTPGTPTDDAQYNARLIRLGNGNFPLMDLHVHLKGDLTMEKALANARKYGFTYGIAVNCGLKMGYENDEQVDKFLASYKKPPETYLAMQAEGREWLTMFSKETIAKFDYVFTDSMTWTNDNGKRMRLWIKEETEVGDPQNFMDQLVDRIEKIMKNEPINIYVNPTYLPDQISARYDELWTIERMDRVIKALVDNKIAMEINDRDKIPSAAFIKRAKAAGVKFTFGTNNTGAGDLGKLQYCIQMVEECNLRLEDMWIPKIK